MTVQHDLIALCGPPHGFFPRNIQLLLCSQTDLCGLGLLLVEPEQAVRHRLRIAVDQETVPPVGHALGRTAAAQHHCAGSAGCRLADNQTVCIISGREQKQVCPAVPRAQFLSVADRACENTERRQIQLFCQCLYFVKISPASDEQHAEVLPVLTKSRECLQNDAQAFIPLHPSHKQEDRHARRQVIIFRDRIHFVFWRAAQRQVHAVLHDNDFALVAEIPKVISGPLADSPHLVAGIHIRKHRPHDFVAHQSAVHDCRNICIKLGVPCQNQRNIPGLPQLPGEHRRHHRAMQMEQIRILLQDVIDRARSKRISRHIAEGFARVDAGIADHGVGKCAVIRPARNFRGNHKSPAVVRIDVCGIVHHSVRDTIDHGRKRVVQQTDCAFVRHDSLRSPFG